MIKYEEIKLPCGEHGKEKIVGIVNFKGDVIIATEWRVLRLSQNEFGESEFAPIEFKAVKDND